MSNRRLSWVWKAALGCGFAVFLAVVLLGLAELGLRVGGYGHAPGFWRMQTAPDGKRWVRENPWVTAPFFAPELQRKPQPFRIQKEKAPGVVRIVVLGSSAAMGDPEASFSMARMLEVMLQRAYPELRFEVINAGVTAINSHVVRGIAADCAELEPDFFVVYEGNNEVIGPFGPATVFTPVLRRPAAIRAAIWLRGLRLGQALTQATRRGKAGVPEDWAGMQMFLQHEIAADDPRLETTAELFASNLRAICESGRKAGAHVILSTVLTNQKDFAPFRSRHASTLRKELQAPREQELTALQSALRTGPVEELEAGLRSWLEQDAGYAEAHFLLGRVLERKGDTAGAKRAYQRALDLDVLRFRTDSRLNQVIRDVARGAGPGVELLDAAEIAAAESPKGIVGDEMLYEHVHLTFRGAYGVAREVFMRVSEELRQRGRLAPEWIGRTPVEVDELRARLAFTTYEQAMITTELLNRFQRPPFTQQSTNPERVAVYRQRAARADLLLQRPESFEAMITLYRQALQDRPDDWVLARNFGSALVARGRADEAKGELLRALAIIPDDPDTLYALILAHRALGETAEAERRVEQLRAVEPRYPGLEKGEGRKASAPPF